MIRKVEISDAKEIVDIYNYYIINTTITFEEERLGVRNMEERIKGTIKSNPWIVYEDRGRILGYAYLGAFRERSAFRYTKESSIYLDKDCIGKGIGIKLYKELLKLAKEWGIHIIVASITLPNPISLAIHEKLGFEKVGEFKAVGYKQEKWLDVGFWQRKLGV